MKNIETVLKHYEKAKARQMLWENLCEEAYHIAMPERNLYERGDEGQDETEGLYDSTVMVAANSFVSTMLRLMFPPDTPYAKLSLGPVIKPEERTELQEIIDRVNEIHFNAVKASNFQVFSVPA